MEYQILEARETKRLEAKVIQLINEGWIPLGGVACKAKAFDPRDGFEFDEAYVQAMYRKAQTTVTARGNTAE